MKPEMERTTTPVVDSIFTERKTLSSRLKVEARALALTIERLEQIDRLLLKLKGNPPGLEVLEMAGELGYPE